MGAVLNTDQPGSDAPDHKERTTTSASEVHPAEKTGAFEPAEQPRSADGVAVPVASAAGQVPRPGTTSSGRPVETPHRLAGAQRVERPGPVADPRRRSRRRRRAGSGVVGVVIAVAASFYLIPSLRETVPSSVPVFGKNADTIYEQLVDAGLPVAHGEPASSEFADLVHNNACKSSTTFVRTDSDRGWGMICVGAPDETQTRIREAFTDIPILLGPLYVDDDDGKTIVIGFGWPTDASETVATAIGASGNYLIKPDS